MRILKETQSLSLADLEKLFDHSDQYMIPYNQQETKRQALVLFNTHQRENSVDEALVMHKGFEEAGFYSKSIEWSDALKLPHVLAEQIHQRVQSTSVLFVCIMSHGKAGMILGNNSSLMPITDILTVIGNNLPQYIPLVSTW